MMVDSALVVSPANREPMDRLDAAHALLGAATESLETVQEQPEQEPAVLRRPRSGSVGLDELAALAVGAMEQPQQENGTVSLSSSSDDDSEAMPPPPPRTVRRPRSCSNPEGMEKWGEPRNFVLPSAILEEELAEASALAKAHEARMQTKRDADNTYGTSPDSVTSPIMLSATMEDEDMEPEELLKRARSRLLEDLSEGSLKGEKGVVTLPHSLSKYKEVSFLNLLHYETNEIVSLT